MDKAMVAAHEEQGATAADVQAACAKVPMHPHMQEARECSVDTVLFKYLTPALAAVHACKSHCLHIHLDQLIFT